MAAKTNNIKILIFPKYNKHNVEELPPLLKDGFEIFYVEHYKEIFNIVFVN